MRSGELARVSGVSADSLRHYERLGILPKPPRTDGGYRDYPPSSLDRVRLIRRALGIGFSLPEVAAVLKLRDGGEFPCREARRLAGSKLEQVRDQIKDLNLMRRQLEKILQDWDIKLAGAWKGQRAYLLEGLPQTAKPNRVPSRLKSNSRLEKKP